MQLSLPMVFFILFLTLKLCGVITWSWIWVTAPLWIGIPLLFLFFFVIVLVNLWDKL